MLEKETKESYTMKFGDISVRQVLQKTSFLRPTEPKHNSDSTKSKAKYKEQLKKLESIFRNTEENNSERMVKDQKLRTLHSQKSKSKSNKSLHKVKNIISGQKENFKNFGSKFNSVRTDSEDEVIGRESEESPSPSLVSKKSSNRITSKNVGLRFYIIATLLGCLFLSALAGVILLPIIHTLGEKYLWNSFGSSSVTVMLSFLGITATTATLLGLYVLIFKLEEIRSKRLDGWNLIICFGVSILIAAITIFISLLQFHDVVEIFGEEFIELLQGYWMTPKFKIGMDRIQMDFGCCGFYSYEDWGKVDDLGEYPKGFVPFSCCSIYRLRPCVHENIPKLQELKMTKLPLREQLSIYHEGCKIPMENYYKSMLDWVIVIASTLITTQIILTLLLTFSRKADFES